ncbi:SAM-dependent methyltransferase [Synechococcus sp. HB1133]|uniref:class I SAM-dependent methyltransferase n=3 Tax=unclassified Synechococcus TaxID=2626047 RepID=UPI001407A09E|nr:SAM-dependent methyltransferase [Synechococcus sp. HBA1120]MCB4395051.1 SAM-dependent methyltransferase [Synechococcus sp. PH41509]MCB4421951.1 SAM-dependent methyltransferase [Synechococcus sp. HB1133]MCB4430102.1 SAM-dependent methyltransferase [Synechococcus sp. HBA1120]NHI80893.1 SAM-dependent methyltransferase [Synechococcus sp. HB1133]
MELLQRSAFSPMKPMAAACPDWLATHLQQAGGAVPFSRFMDLALNEQEHGYYGAGRARIGTQGDFVTSPSLGSDFAALLAPQLLTWLASLSRTDSDQRLSIVEIGPGEGHLARDLIAQLLSSDSALLPQIEMVLVEVNPGMRQRQQALLPQVDGFSVRWCSLEQLRSDPVRGVVIAHELLDALPVERLVWRDGSLQQEWVELDQTHELRTTHRPLPVALQDEINRVCINHGIQLPPPDAEEGWTTEWNSSLPDWFATVAAALDSGVLLVIDYALEAHRYYTARRSEGTLMAVRAQQAGLSPLHQPGEQDLTAHLCIDVVAEAAKGSGWLVGDQAKQGEALLALGLAERLHDLQQLPGQRLAEALQRREALLRLVDPAGLGAFRWLTYLWGLPEGAFSLSAAPGSSESARD